MRRPQMDLVAFVDFPPEAMLIERVRFNFHSEVWVFSRSKMWVFRHVRIMSRSGPLRHGKKISSTFKLAHFQRESLSRHEIGSLQTPRQYS